MKRKGQDHGINRLLNLYINLNANRFKSESLLINSKTDSINKIISKFSQIKKNASTKKSKQIYKYLNKEKIILNNCINIKKEIKNFYLKTNKFIINNKKNNFDKKIIVIKNESIKSLKIIQNNYNEAYKKFEYYKEIYEKNLKSKINKNDILFIIIFIIMIIILYLIKKIL